MNPAFKDEEIYLWYGYIKDSRDKNITGKHYCEIHNLSYKKFSNMKQRLQYKKFSNPDSYEKLYKAVIESITKNIGPKDIRNLCIKHNICFQHFSEMKTHLRYLEVVEKMKIKADKKSSVAAEMTFRQIQPSNPAVIDEPEIIQARNDIELTIINGVRVICSPELDSMKLIKIIELLKDL